MFDIGGGEMLLIVLAVLILFGPKKLPELAQSLGKGIREFKRAQREFTDHINGAFDDEQRKQNVKNTTYVGNTVARGEVNRYSSYDRTSEDVLIPAPVTEPVALPHSTEHEGAHSDMASSELTTVQHAETQQATAQALAEAPHAPEAHATTEHESTGAHGTNT